MNQHIYKLVYSKVLNMLVPVSEAARGHVSKRGKRVRSNAKNLLCFFLIGNLLYVGLVSADPAGLVPGTQAWVNATISNSTNTSMTIRQSAPKAILDWQKLNLNAGETLRYDQQGSRTWSALNRIHDLNPSILNGNVFADGNVFFINTNGIIFGQNALFNVGSIYAGTLDIKDKLFNDGFINSDGITNTNVFGDGVAGLGGFVTVQNGAQINAATGGKVMLFAPTVTNNGIINTPDGQTILAAGNKVYLASSKDPAGFLVEVGGGGTATNLGKIIAERGNITMMGLAVNQSGTLSATTSVRANGSIRLLAQDGVTGATNTGTRNGIVTLAKGSITEVTPEYANKEESTASQPFNTSSVSIEASLVNIDGTVSVKGGNVSVDASQTASAQLATMLDANNNLINPNNLPNKIYLGSNAIIDVSGVNAVAPMSRNQLEIQLFSDQLKDAPILRDGGLFKQTVYVDARKGTALFDIKPFLDLKGATVAEKMTNAGSVKFTTPNTVVSETGSVINVSGGSTTYEAGTIKETNLFYNGKLVPISEAQPGVPYDKVSDLYTVKDNKWGVTRGWDLVGGNTQNWGGVVPSKTNSDLKTTIVGTQFTGYIEGDDAGSLQIRHPDGDKGIINHLILKGTFLANTQLGRQQLIDQNIPQGGIFTASANDLLIAKNANGIVSGAFEQAIANNTQSFVSTDIFANGFNNIDLSGAKKIVINDAVNLDPNGKLKLGRAVDGAVTQINANITAPGTDIQLNSTVTNVADGTVISTAGKFTNDRAGIPGRFSQAAAINGGNITASTDSVLNLGKNVTLDVSAGAALDNKGRFAQGNAGAIKFKTAAKVDDSVKFLGYGFDKGGSLEIDYEGQNLNIAGNPLASATDVDISPSFFNRGGFSKYALSGLDVNIGDNASGPVEIYALAQNWQMNPDYRNQPGNQAISSVATPLVLPEASRNAVSLSFAASNITGTLTLAENATIRTDRGGSVDLSAGKQVNVLGDVVTPSGNINVKITDKDLTGDILYDPTQGVYIGEKANLIATGSTLTLPSRPSILNTQVFNGGTISIDAPKGALVVKDGAVLDVSGTNIVNDTNTANGLNREVLYGDAGTIKLSASDGLLLDGSFKGAAQGTGRAGTLNIGITEAKLVGTPFLTGNREITLTQNKQLRAQNMTVGSELKNSLGDTYVTGSSDEIHGQISAEQIAQGGFANLTIGTTNPDTPIRLGTINLDSGLDLKMAGNVKLDTQQINVKNDGITKLTASAITFKNLDASSAAVAGAGSLEANAKQIYFDGKSTVSGVNKTTINAEKDITSTGGNTETGLSVIGELNLKARQIYPATNSKLSFEAIGDNSKITVSSSGAAPTPVYSAAGELSLKAANVLQSGVLSAPFGKITIDAANSAVFSAGSITSVSANGLVIPYGGTSKGGQLFNPNGTESTPPKDKSISISSKNVDLQKDAVIDLSGGGDMLGAEWVPGIGGTKDVLLQPNMYAVIPSYGQNYAPTDNAQNNPNQPVGIGQTVYLTGVPGLASGYYTLLPARYALVPGAFLVESKVAGGSLLPPQTAPQLDGSHLTSGFFAEIGTGSRDANWSTFRVTDGAIFRPASGATSKAPSQYILTSVNEFFSNPLKTNGQDVSLPKDTARLSLEASKLSLESTIKANKQEGGDGLQVDISSSNIRVVDSIGADDGSLQLTAAKLSGLDADSLLLGGKRDLQSGVTNVSTSATTVSIENDSNSIIKTPELIVAATDKVTVKAGAIIDTGAAVASPTTTNLQASGDGALLALSSNHDINYSRAVNSPNAAQGELAIEAGSTLKAGRSVVVDATKLATLNSNVALQDGGSATFGANRILLGAAPPDVLGLNINNAALSALGQIKSLALNSYSNIDTFGSFNFGNTNLNLTINAAGIVGNLASGETSAPANAAPVVFAANTFTFKNSQGATFTAPTAPSGRALEINANTVRFEGGQTAKTTTQIAGYTQLNVNADEVRVAKAGETNIDVANTKITTGLVTAENAADFKIKAGTNLEIASKAVATTNQQKGFGAKLDIAADNLTVGSNIDLSSGQLSLTSTNNLNINNGAKITATSTPIAFYNKVVNAPAGSVTLTSNTGNVNVNTGAVVDVSSQGSADAGTVNISATNGTANIAGDIKGAANGTGKGGELSVDVRNLADLAATNKQATGFSEARQYRVRTGDVAIAGTVANGDALVARDTAVSADAGKITVSGDIIATAPKNSHIGLYAGNGVTLTGTANLQANSTKAGEAGGKVEIYTRDTASLLDLQGGTINVSGGDGGAGGNVKLRAPRTGAASGDGVGVTNLATTITGANQAVLEAFRVFNNITTINTGAATGAGGNLGFTTVANDVNSFMANKDNILASLNKTGDSTFHLRAGTEIRSNANLQIGSDWNLYSATRTGDEPGVLTLRAVGNVTFNGSLSDGFLTAASSSAIGTGDSWAYRIIAGADFGASNPLDTIASTTSGNLTLTNGTNTNTRMIRTGTGDIDIATGGNLVMGGSNTAIYTAGRTAANLDGFDAPANAQNPLYLTDGGDIGIDTKGNIVGGESTAGSRQLINQWLYRQGGGSGNLDSSWWVRPDLFKQSLATLGGGNINVQASGNISNFSASAPTTARYDTNDLTGNQSMDGGGDVKVKAGGDITNGAYFVAKGDGQISAGGSIVKSDNTFGTTLALQEGKFDVVARKNAYIETTINPTLAAQSTANAGSLTDLTGRNASFNTYSEQAKVTVSSLTGNAVFGAGTSTDIASKVTGLINQARVNDAYKYTPGNLSVVSFNGDANVGNANPTAGGTTLLPSPTGNLNVLAANNVKLGSILVSDADPAALPTKNKPTTAAGMTLVSQQLTGHAGQLLHENDTEPAMVVAQNGDIDTLELNTTLTLPKPSLIVAGRDVANVNLVGQNNNANDVTLIKAGNDIKVGNIYLAGPGELLVQAGRNIDLTNTSADIAATGNFGLTSATGNTLQASNPALPAEGANITLQAGLGKGAALDSYITQYILPSGTGPATLQSDTVALAAYRANTTDAVVAYMLKLGKITPVQPADSSAKAAADAKAQTEALAFAAFNLLSAESKTVFVNRHLSSELMASGETFAKTQNHNRGYQAIASLFPTLNQGDILLYASKVSTNSGGSIDLVAPGGLINIGAPGLAVKDPNNPTNPGEIGVITEKGGAIRGTANGDFQVNQSKLITQFGSDISIWSTTGTIDAGRGSKTATSIPTRIVQTDADGNTTVEVRGVAAGSGIRAQSYDEDGPNGPKIAPNKGKVRLVAPIVNAGEAGIEAGDLLIVAPVVLNAANIQVSGTASGVPVAATSGIASAGAGLSPDAVNSATASVAQSVAQSANQSFVKPAMPSILSVDVISIGR